ncbi:hypothetical protein C8R45DRAFT_921414 [Mycena sanguinolenta]|nr:hypothetical protein C8R45DRAFT_921414 [Mycena sanguinolenta]
MIGPSASFYDPDQSQWDYQAQQQFEFAYPAPGPSYDELVAQFYSQPPPPPQPQQQHPQQQQRTQQYPAYPQPVQSTSNGVPNNHNSNPNITTTPNKHNDSPPPAATSSGPAPKRKRVAKKPAQAPQSVDSDNSDSDDGFGFSGGGGAGISVGMGGLGVRSKGARLPGACTHCKKLKMKCDFGPGGSGTRDPADNTCRRCRAGGHVCIVEGRKPRSAPKDDETRRGVAGSCILRLFRFAGELRGEAAQPRQRREEDQRSGQVLSFGQLSGDPPPCFLCFGAQTERGARGRGAYTVRGVHPSRSCVIFETDGWRARRRARTARSVYGNGRRWRWRRLTQRHFACTHRDRVESLVRPDQYHDIQTEQLGVGGMRDGS